MTKAAPLNVRVDENLKAGVQRLCEATDRPMTWHVEQALRAYLLQEKAWLDAVEAGRASAAQEPVIDPGRVDNWLATWGATDETMTGISTDNSIETESEDHLE